MATEHEHDGPSHPADRPVEPDHPMVLNGGAVMGNVELMARCMIEEMLQVGTPAERLRAMSRDPEYQALAAMRRSLGDRLDEIIEQALARVGVHRHATREATGDVRPASLTIGATGR